MNDDTETQPQLQEPMLFGYLDALEEADAQEAAEEVEVQSEAIVEPEPEVIAEAEAEAEVAAAPTEAPAAAAGVSWVPFSVYLGAWIILAVGTIVVLRKPAVVGGALWAPEYAYTVYGGVALAALGPVLALGVWLVTRAGRAKEDRKGLFASALLNGASVTFIGAVLWLIALYVLDLYRMGVFA